MSPADRDMVVAAFQAKLDADRKLEQANAVLLRVLPDNGQLYAMPGTPFFVCRQGQTVRVKVTNRVPSIDDLVKP